MKKLFLSLSIITIFFACTKEDDDILVDDPNAEPIVLSGREEAPLILENIFSNPNTPDYILEGNWRLEAPVEVEPGVRILVKSGATINIESSGSFKADGTEEEPIYIEGEEDIKGYWRHFSFGSNSLNNVLNYCFISNGGGGNTLASGNGTIRIESNSRVSITNTTIRKSDRYGVVSTSSQGVAFSAFSNNTINDCNSYPLSVYLNQVEEIDETSDFFNNGFDLIEVKSSDINDEVSMNSASVPYFMAPGHSKINAALEISEGTAIKMGPESRWTVESLGSLAISGTASNRVSITGNEEISGYWNYISYFGSNSNNNYIQYADIAYGGGSNLSCCNAILIVSDNALLNLEESSISNSSKYGIRISGSSTFNDLGGNTFSNNALGDIDD